jgi:hypothetical protein
MNPVQKPGRVVQNLAPHIDENCLVGKCCIAPSIFVNQQSTTQTVRDTNQLLICARTSYLGPLDATFIDMYSNETYLPKIVDRAQ